MKPKNKKIINIKVDTKNAFIKKTKCGDVLSFHLTKEILNQI